MSTIDIFGKTTSESGTIKTEGLTLSEADFLFLRKNGFTPTTTILTSKNVVDNITQLSNTWVKSFDPFIPQLTSNTTDFTVIASSELSAAYAGYKAFNMQADNEWASNGITSDYYILIKLPFPISIHSFSVMGRTNSHSPRSWVFQGSNDGVNWTDLYNADNYPMYGGTLITIKIPNNKPLLPPTPYRYYGIYVFTSIQNSVNPGLAYFNIYAYVPR